MLFARHHEHENVVVEGAGGGGGELEVELEDASCADCYESQKRVLLCRSAWQQMQGEVQISLMDITMDPGKRENNNIPPKSFELPTPADSDPFVLLFIAAHHNPRPPDKRQRDRTNTAGANKPPINSPVVSSTACYHRPVPVKPRPQTQPNPILQPIGSTYVSFGAPPITQQRRPRTSRQQTRPHHHVITLPRATQQHKTTTKKGHVPLKLARYD
jgi:hypothetical protein